ncbi:MAG: cobalamin B12-binding domain-containing protein [Coriobacteriia bacterium]|nr:cobalamin B12-binding domain-containing protein [Coriobacteriia bacterium]MBN2840470.1 cobalamin B12-binding domain-containing protein [Coriobacteriia bacterium]
MSDAVTSFKRTLCDHISAHDRAGATLAALDAVRAGAITIPELYDLLAAYLVEVGARWQAGESEVWEEHYATSTVRTIVEACQPLVAERAAAPIGRTVVLATPPDEYHDLGLRMLADRFTLAGWTAQLLGANVPTDELIAAIAELEADAVVISAYTHFHRFALKEYVNTVRAAHPDIHVWVGGAAFALEHDGWPDEMMLKPADVPSLAGQVG